jgi:hypothetical protein
MCNQTFEMNSEHTRTCHSLNTSSLNITGNLHSKYKAPEHFFIVFYVCSVIYFVLLLPIMGWMSLNSVML